ncbi:MAG: M13 family metallopeptidase [Gammaproteobacteria bacterium]
MNHRFKKYCGAATAAIFLVGHAGAAHAEATPVDPAAAASSQAPAQVAGIYPAHMDRSLRPQDDFYQFVNGGWLASAEIPADRAVWGAGTELVEQAEQRVLAIIEEAVATRDGQTDPDLAKIADLYESFMAEDVIEAAGLAPLAGLLAEIDAIEDHGALVEAFGALRADGVGITLPMAFWVDLDMADTERYALYVTQSGLGMPDRDYYLLDNERMVETRAAYLAYIQQLFVLAGATAEDAAAAAGRVLALETALAERHWTRAERRDRQLTYNPVTLASLAEQAPDFDWSRYFAAAGVDPAHTLIVRELSYFPAMAELLVATPMETWREYLRFMALNQAAPLLPADFVAAHFDFNSRTISGVPEMRPRWKRGVATVERALGEAIGREYVARHFSPTARARMETLVANLTTAFRQSIDELDWMSDETKAEAQDKLASFGLKIGYPDQWRDYSALQVSADDLVANVTNANRFAYARSIERLGGPVDPDEWFMTPQTVNAYYSPTRNEIVFPAAILQPPLFNPDADDAVNYGGIGGVIGHEISHGFDDQGRRTDGRGLLRDWWTEEDDARYRELTDRLVEQYSAFEPLEGVNIDGRVSLGENIADLAGLTVAHRAYRLSLGDEEAPVIDGFSGDERFFLGWAQSWRIKYREDALRRQLMTGPHSPGPYRVTGVVRNVDAFYEAFGIGPDDGMWYPPEERVAIW